MALKRGRQHHVALPVTGRPSPDPQPLLLLLVFVSGATALVYQSLWLRSFGLVFGNTTDALAMVLAVFMAGLGAGSLLAARHRAAAPLGTYSRVEIGIGATALLTVPLLNALPAAYAAIARHAALAGPAAALGRGLSASIIIFPTTLLLGTTVPLLVEFLDREGAGFHTSLGRLYLFNTLGAATGACLATFALVPGLGVKATLSLSALANILVGVAARSMGPTAPIAPAPEKPAPQAPVPGTFAVMAATSGAFTFGIEILWTRSLALVIGSTVYAFTLMLLAVLLGLAGGTVAYIRLRERMTEPRRILGVAFVSIGLSALAGVFAIGALPALSLALLRVVPLTFAAHQIAAFALCLVTMLPVTITLGFTFPLLSHLADRAGRSAQEASGRLYLWNTVGAIVGALTTDLVLVRAFGLQISYLVLASWMLAAGAWLLGAAASRPSALRVGAAAAAIAGVAALGPWWHPWNPILMTSGVHRYGVEWSLDPSFRLEDLTSQRRLLFYREGREAVIAAFESVTTSRRFLSIDGKTDAGGGAEDALQQKFVAHVPLLLHPGARRVLVVGWGSGATAASAALYPLDRLDCVEIEPATFEAAPVFESLSGAVRRDPRFRIAFRDGRNYLLGSQEKWDVIASEPSNAWISGVANLFTQEYYEVARNRLATHGLFAQWFHYYNLEPADVKVELATFAAVFSYVSVWQAPPLPPELGGLSADMLLVGSMEPQGIDWRRLEKAFRTTSVGKDLQSTRAIQDELAVVASYSFGRDDLLRLTSDKDAFPDGTPLNTDDRPWIEFRAARHLVLPPPEVRRLAQVIHLSLGEAAADPMPPLTGHPALAAGGPDAAGLVAALAARWEQAGLSGRAGRAFEKALALDPSCEPALEHLGEAAIDAGDWRRAEDLHRALVRLRPTDVDARLRLAAIFVRQLKWLEARDAFQEALRLNPLAPINADLQAYVESQLAAGQRRE